MTRTLDSDGTFKTKLPSKSVTVPWEVFPFTTTEAPIKGSSLASVTVPLTEMLFWAYSVVLNANNMSVAETVCLINCFRFFILTDFDT